MATLLKWEGDGLTHGANVTTSSAGPGDTAPAAVTGTVPKIDASGARPPRIKFTQLAAAASYCQWNHADSGTLAWRWYTRFSGVGSGEYTIAQGMNFTNQRWRLGMAGTSASNPGQLRLRDTGNTQVDSSGSLLIPMNTELRIEATLAADILTAWVFEGDSLTEMFSVTGDVGTTVTCTGIRVGNILTSPTAPAFYVDDLQIDDVAVRIGPAGEPAFPTFAVHDGVDELPLTLEGVWDGVSVVPLTFGQLA